MKNKIENRASNFMKDFKKLLDKYKIEEVFLVKDGEFHKGYMFGFPETGENHLIIATNESCSCCGENEE